MAKHRNIVLCMPLTQIFMSVARGLNTVAAQERWLLRHCHSPKDIPEAVAAYQPVGLVFGKADEYFARATPDDLRGRAAVAVESDLTAWGVPSACVDDEATGREAAQHLLARGLRHCAAFAIHGLPWAQARVRGFRQAIEEAGGTYHGGGDQINGPGAGMAVTDRHIGAWLRPLPRPLGLFTCCDPWGVLVATVCEAAELRVPEDVAIIGADNDELTCELAHPPLSSVAIPWVRVGIEGGRLLARMLAGEPVAPDTRISVTPTAVVTRRSSDTVSVPDEDVAAALSFILNNAHRAIGVDDVVRATTTYRRRLEQRFRQTLGRTIRQEIQRVHIEQAKRLLTTTDLSIADVATGSGFANAKRLAETFQLVVGLTATEFRRTRGRSNGS